MTSLGEIQNRWAGHMNYGPHQVVADEHLYRRMCDDLTAAFREFCASHQRKPAEMRVDRRTELEWASAADAAEKRLELRCAPSLPSRFLGIPIVYGQERFEASSFRPQTDVFVVNQESQ